MNKIFLICPVRNASDSQKEEMQKYILELEKDNSVYYPARDTNQIDNVGFRICMDNFKAIDDADEVHIYFDKDSQGSLFDLGMAFALKKPIVVVNKSDLLPTETKSFTNMILRWSNEG